MMNDNDNTFDLTDRSQMPSLHDPEVCQDALEAYLDPEDRMTDNLAFLFCDDDGHLLQPVLVPAPPPPAAEGQRWAAMDWATELCEMVGDDHHGPLSLVLAIVREDGPVCDDDRVWHQVALDACAEAGVPLIGVHVVTMAGAQLLPTAPHAA